MKRIVIILSIVSTLFTFTLISVDSHKIGSENLQIVTQEKVHKYNDPIGHIH